MLDQTYLFNFITLKSTQNLYNIHKMNICHKSDVHCVSFFVNMFLNTIECNLFFLQYIYLLLCYKHALNRFMRRLGESITHHSFFITQKNDNRCLLNKTFSFKHETFIYYFL